MNSPGEGDLPNVQVVVLSGPSGSGKTTVVQRLQEQSPVKLVKAISATTRRPRPGERPDEDYFFLSLDEFQHRLANDEFVESFEVHGTGNWYGTLKSEIQRAVTEGGWSLLEIDVQGAQRVVQRYPEAITIFLSTSSLDEYERRLRNRGTETDEAIQRRMQNAQTELQHRGRYQHQVINDNLQQAVQEISSILATREAEIHARRP